MQIFFRVILLAAAFINTGSQLSASVVFGDLCISHAGEPSLRLAIPEM